MSSWQQWCISEVGSGLPSCVLVRAKLKTGPTCQDANCVLHDAFMLRAPYVVHI